MSDKNVDQVRDHLYDGIEEYDNHLPRWWLFLLYASIVFAVGYWLVFHSLKIIDLPPAKYEKAMIAATEAQLDRMAAGGLNNESLLLMSTLPAQVEEGNKLFQTYCVACHLERGQGSIGPNLTDRYWIHGGQPMDLYNTVTSGVLDKGMAAWGKQLGPRRVQSIVAHLLAIKNTEVPGKAPEGVLLEEIAPAVEETPGDRTSAGQLEETQGAPAEPPVGSTP